MRFFLSFDRTLPFAVRAVILSRVPLCDGPVKCGRPRAGRQQRRLWQLMVAPICSGFYEDLDTFSVFSKRGGCRNVESSVAGGGRCRFSCWH